MESLIKRETYLATISYLCRMNIKLKLTVIIQSVPEGGYVAFIEEIPGVNTQGETVEEAKENLFDALNLSMDYKVGNRNS